MNELQTIQSIDKKNIISTVDIADMMEMTHKSILRKLEGRTVNGKHTDGVIDIINRHQMAPVEYFIESSYIDAKGESRKCYDCTRKGCEFLAHKFQGEKGILFTIRYIERFHQMEKVINEQYQQIDNNMQVPKISEKRKELQNKIEKIAKRQNLKRKQVIRKIMIELGKTHNLETAKAQYKNKFGFDPPYAMDLIEAFPELTEKAEEITDTMMEKSALFEKSVIEAEKVFSNW